MFHILGCINNSTAVKLAVKNEVNQTTTHVRAAFGLKHSLRFLRGCTGS